MLIAKKVVALMLVMVVASVSSACMLSQPIDAPKDGVWYGAELNMILSKEDGISSMFEIDGVMTEVEWCFYFDNHTFDLLTAGSNPHAVFHGDCRGIDDTHILVTDLSDRKEYIFVRQFPDGN